MPDKDPKEMSLEELQTCTASLKAQVEHKDDEHKQAMEDEEKKAKQAQEEEKKNHDAQEEKKDEEHKAKMASLRANMLTAMEEKDEEKKDAAMKAVLEAMEDEHKKEAMHEDEHKAQDDEEKKAMKAEITYLKASVNKPKLDYLNKVYSAAKTEDGTLKKWNSEWEAMSSKQLDAAIEKAKPLVDTLSYEASQPEEKNPFGFTTAEGPGEKEYSASKKFDKIDKLSDEELFGGNMYA